MQSISSPDKVFNGHSALLHHIDCSPDGTRILTTGIDNAAKIWSLKTGELIGELAPDSGYTLSAGFSKDGTKIVTGGSYGFIRLWDAVTLAPIKNLVGITQEISTIVFSPDGKKIAANTNDGKVFIWNTLTGNLETTFSKTNTPFFTMKYSPDGTQLGLAMWTSWICNSTTGEELWSKTSVAHQVGFLDFSPVGSLIALSEYERKILICSATTGDSLREFQGCLNEDFIFTPNGKYLLSGSSAMAFLYDITTGEPIKCFKLLTTVLNSGKGVAVSKDGSRLFTSLGGRVQVWDGTEYSSIKNTQPKPTSINTKTWYFNNSTNTLHFPKVDNTINMTYNLQLFEMSGRRITSVEYTMKNRSAHIHLPQQLPPGLYFFRIESNLGSSGTGTFISIRK
jgi:WD40 repeat protein